MEKNKLKILILVLSIDDGSIYSDFYKTQKETWDSIQVEGVTTFYFFGNAKENKIIGNEILLNIDEGLDNCGQKTILCLDLIKSMEFDYILRTNSSSYIDKRMLRDHLYHKQRIKYYSGVIGEHNGIKFASGSGYILSKDLITTIITKSVYWDHSFLDDVSLGILLSQEMVFPQNAPRYEIITKNKLQLYFTPTPLNHYHYRLKSRNRNLDILQMKKIFKLKQKC